MDFTGKYELESQENFVPFMKAIGLSQDQIEMGKNIRTVTEVEQNGDHFTVKVTTGSQVLVNTFTAGQESEIETITGEKVKATFILEDNKLKVTCKGITSVTEKIDADTIVNTLTAAGISYKRTSKLVKN